MNSASDAVNDGCDSSHCSLREALELANATAGTELIAFDIPGTGPFTIQLSTGLPEITSPVVIDATTQPGYADRPLIELDGTNASSWPGLWITGGGTTVRGLAIGGFQQGILIQGAGGNAIERNHIGTDASGTVARGNFGAGVAIAGSPGNTVGGGDSLRNIISGNSGSGVAISGAAAVGNIVRGNYIGTDRTGTVGLGNGFHVATEPLVGVSVANAVDTVIGGSAAGAGNLISGNRSHGIALWFSSDPSNCPTESTCFTGSGHRIEGNLIGTDATGESALANVLDGILVDGVPGVRVGGSHSGAGNLISGNIGSGLRIQGYWNAQNTGTLIEGNLVGTDRSGARAVRNLEFGIAVHNASRNAVGGTTEGAGNVISGNGGFGILIDTRHGSTPADLNSVQGNFVGTDLSGRNAVPNGGGIGIHRAHDNEVGGPGAGNLISGNGGVGVQLSEAQDTVVQGNFIGTDVDGTAAVPNADSGVRIRSGQFTPNVIGGAEAAAANLISGNGGSGVHITQVAGVGHMVQGNFIGTDVTGEQPLGNVGAGVMIDDPATSAASVIGYDGTAPGNVIAFNGGDGVFVAGTTRNPILANEIFDNGGLGIDLDPDGVTNNDPGDEDTGPNDLQNFPVLLRATTSPEGTTIDLSLDSHPGQTFLIEFFISPACDASGHGEAASFFGWTEVETDGTGVAEYQVGVPGVVPAGHVVTATASLSHESFPPPGVGGTSELSACLEPTHLTQTVFLANITKTLGGPGGWYTPFIVQNVGEVDTDLEITFYRFSDGEPVAFRDVRGLKPGTAFADIPNNDADLPDDTQFSVVVHSFGAPIVAVVNEHQGSGARAEAGSYVGAATGATSVFLPNIVRRYNGFVTPFIMQNLGTATTIATASFISFDRLKTATITRTIAPGQSQFIDPNAEATLADGQYAVTVTATQPISVVVNTHRDTADIPDPVMYSTNGLTGGAARLYGPYAVKMVSGVGKGIATIVVQNLGEAAVTPSLTFTPLGGGTPTTITGPSTPAKAAWAFDPRFNDGTDTTQPCGSTASTGCLADGEYSFVASSDPEGTIAAAVNVIGAPTGDRTAAGYMAVPSPAGKLFLPNVTRTLGGTNGWTTPLLIQSVDATSLTLQWFRFADGELAITQTLDIPAGAAIRIDPREVAGLADDTQYAVVVQAGSGKIAAIVHELNFEGGDGAMIYEGFAAGD